MGLSKSVYAYAYINTVILVDTKKGDIRHDLKKNYCRQYIMNEQKITSK